ncbi:MAG: type VI secretion system baseplate subunit TssF [Enterobacteriaceae bacterium]|jgi:type VI secretion system protein ImpG|nr:type VI secretion system baseplate subunit TssF [Enterobacteriaceae bacterium]
MPLQHQFQDEMTFIKSAIHDFADTNPQLSQFLIEKGKDPDVERMLDGLAYMTATLKAKLKQDFPNLTQDVIQLLWSNYLRPVPSITMINAASLSHRTSTIPKGTQVTTSASDQPACIFQTCRDLTVTPVTLESSQIIRESSDSLLLTFSFSNTPESLDLEQFSFYLGQDPYIGSQLYMMLTHYVTSVAVVINNAELPLEAPTFNLVGFERSDAMIPYPENTNTGNRLLQEYFCFNEGFLFLRIAHENKNIFPKSLKYSTFSLKINFSRSFPPSLKLRNDSILINCVPAINLFHHDGEPIILHGRKSQYPIVASYQYPERYDIFSIEHVESGNRRSAAPDNQHKYTYVPFNSFKHQIQREKGYQRLYYQSKQTQDIENKNITHWLSFVRSDEERWQHKDEIISLRLMCTNNDMPAQLHIGEISHITDKTLAEVVRVKNITRPTLQLSPILDNTLYWKAISNLAQNYMSLLDVDMLKQTLIGYNFPAQHNRQSEKNAIKQLSGIHKMETKPSERKLPDGLIVRGSETSIYMKQSMFNSEGEMVLFGTVLSQFFSQVAALNSYHLLTMINMDNQERYTWPVKIGQHSLI